MKHDLSTYEGLVHVLMKTSLGVFADTHIKPAFGTADDLVDDRHLQADCASERAGDARREGTSHTEAAQAFALNVMD